jgi:Outer membrane protein beta-barrel domain
MKRLLATLCLLVITITTFAQDEQSFHFGLKVAPSLAWLKSDTKGYDSDGSIFGFTYGLITDFNFAQRYAFGTGIDITYRGGKFKSVEGLKTTVGEDSIISTSSTYNMQYIEIPITLKLKTNEIGSVTYFMQIGVSPGVCIRARQSYASTTQRTVSGTVYNTSASEDKIDVMDDINNFNLSMIIGAGLEYTLSGSTVLLGGIQFNNGFLDAFDGTPKVNTNYLALTLGVLF